MKILLTIFLTLVFLGANDDFTIKGKHSKRVTLVKNDFKILEFKKRIEDILVSDSTKVEVLFVKNDAKPLQTIKLFAKDFGYTKLLITFEDKTTLLSEISIVQNFSKIIEVVKAINSDINVYQANGKVILKGLAKDTKEKLKIEELFSKAGVDIQKDLINLLDVKKPNKMIRIKLYVTEINNNDDLDIKNNWILGYKSFATNYKDNIVFDTDADVKGYTPALTNAIENSVSLTGGLSMAANYLGSGFNTGLTLNYLASKGVATILDETELITLENKKSVFHAGGKIYIKTQTTTAQGLPSTNLKEIDYGLKLEVEVNNIINDEYVNLTITTKQDKINWNEQVDGIPGFSNQSVNTFVIVKNKATIVLGGLVNNKDAKSYWKTPLLGDLPVLGTLFRSKNFQSGKSELVFFIVPQIVDPAISEDNEKLKTVKNKIAKLTKDEDEKVIEPKPKIEKTKELTNEELHKKRLKEVFGM